MPRVFTQAFCVVGAILERDGKILLVKEATKGHPDFGKWNQPAGWLEVGEEPLTAVKREVVEETGFDFEPTHLLGVYSLVRDDITKEMGATPHCLKLIFTGDISTAPPAELADDVSETKWFSPEEIYAMDTHTLRDVDIKHMVKDYFSGKRFALDALMHTVTMRK